MRPDTKKRLDRLIFRQRLKYGLIATGVAASVLAFALFMGYEQTINVDAVVSTKVLDGTITQAIRGASRRSGYNLIVKLDDGRSVITRSLLPAIPYKGERLTLKELVHKSGRKDYVATRLGTTRE